jgi:hypothetical protein
MSMTRSLFQKPRGTEFAGRYDADDNRDLRRRPYLNDNFRDHPTAPRSFFSRLPLIVKLIVLLMCATAGVIISSMLWLIIGSLTMQR